jgi:mitochondrial import inner membrane translocase subunit TIM10
LIYGLISLLYCRMSKACFEKCVVKQNESDLNVGEMACVDRCVGKYMQTQEKVGEVLNRFEQQMKAQEAAGLPNTAFKPKL